MYPVGENTFGINDDDFDLLFSEGKLVIDGLACERIPAGKEEARDRA